MSRALVVTAKWIWTVLAGLVVTLILGLTLVPPATRWFTDSWGATAEEISAKLPGDDVFPARREISTKAITIEAPPGVVYSLIQQMGQHRGAGTGGTGSTTRAALRAS